MMYPQDVLFCSLRGYRLLRSTIVENWYLWQLYGGRTRVVVRLLDSCRRFSGPIAGRYLLLLPDHPFTYLTSLYSYLYISLLNTCTIINIRVTKEMEPPWPARGSLMTKLGFHCLLRRQADLPSTSRLLTLSLAILPVHQRSAGHYPPRRRWLVFGQGLGGQGLPLSKLIIAALVRFFYIRCDVFGDTALVIQFLAPCLIRQYSRLCISLYQVSLACVKSITQ